MKLAASLTPDDEANPVARVVPSALCTGLRVIVSKLPTYPSVPAESILIFSTCWPEASGIEFFTTVVHLVHDPVLAIESDPVRSTPSTSTWKRPPIPSDDTFIA